MIRQADFVFDIAQSTFRHAIDYQHFCGKTKYMCDLHQFRDYETCSLANEILQQNTSLNNVFL